MNASLVVAIITVNFCLVMFLAARTVVHQEQAHFRRTMWRARDELLAQVYDGAVPDSAEVRSYIDRLEAVARLAARWTPFGLWWMNRAIRRSHPRHLPGPAWVPESTLDGAPLREVLDIQRTYHRAFVRLLLLGSPSGWLLSLTLPVVVVMLAFARRRRDGAVSDEMAAARAQRIHDAGPVERIVYRIQDRTDVLPGDIAQAVIDEDGDALVPAYA